MNGRINKTEAPVVPIKFVSIAPINKNAMFTLAFDSKSAKTYIPPAATYNAKSRQINDAYSALLCNTYAKSGQKIKDQLLLATINLQKE